MGEGSIEESQEIRRRLLRRSADNEEFRHKLLADPKAVIQEEIGAKLPENVKVRIVEETPETIYLVLPPKTPYKPASGGELSDRELEGVAGGWEGVESSLDGSCR